MKKDESLKKIRKRRSKDDFYSLYDYIQGGIIDNGPNEKLLSDIVFQIWEGGVSISTLSVAFSRPVDSIREFIRNHLCLPVFQEVLIDFKNNKSIEDIAASTQFSEKKIKHIVEFVKSEG